MKNAKTLTALVLAGALLVVALSACLVACNPEEWNATSVTYHTTTATMPSNWNEFTYVDNNDTQILNYISSSFFDYDYDFGGNKYNADGSINASAIVSGGYTTNYSAATNLEDVTATVDAKWGYTEEQKAEGGYAWKITLRDDLKWDDGTEIHADDFVYSMKEILNPDFLNYRANTYYDTLKIKNSREYFYSGAPLYTPIVPAYESSETPDYSFDIDKNDVYLNVDSLEMTLASYSLSELITEYVEDKTGEAAAALETIAAAANEYGYTLITEENKQTAITLVSYAVSPFGLDWSALSDADKDGLFKECLFYISGYGDEAEWESVGMYKVDENSFVVCLDKAYSFLKEDGSLSYLSAYYMSSLPLVKQSLYESCKIAPAAGSTLWTSNYNSSLETTASWGPYKLGSFQSGKAYTLVKNDNWYGYNMEEYKGQYLIETIECEKVAESNTIWLKYLSGEVDGASLDAEHIAEYKDSKYVTWTPSTGTFGMQVYGNLSVLKASGNNNGILAIDEFRQALSLGLNRADVVEKIWPGTTVACFGLMNDQYYYDVENGGVYRHTTEAKEGILRAYGFTKNADGTWSGGELSNASLDDAYEALTGYNPTEAKAKFAEAVEILTKNAEYYGYDSSKEITIVYGSSVDTEKQRFRCNYVQELIDGLAEGTALEGKIKMKFDASAGSGWADAFRTGATQIGFGYGFSGNAFNPFSIVGGFVDPDDSLNYHMYWDTSAVKLTLTLPAGDYEGAGQTFTMGLDNWYFCLNGLAAENDAEFKYNWDAGFAPASVRCTILAALEEQVIKKAYSIMLIGEYAGELNSAKFSNISDEYNTFMGFGGFRYIQVNYNDGQWAKYVAEHNNDLTAEYKKAE